MKQHTYIAIDLKSFYASVECRERGLDPLNTNLVVADESRTDKTICLAVTPSLKSYGISGRGRLFEVKQRVKEANAGRQHDAPGRRLEGSSHFFSELQADPSLAIDFIIAPPRMAYYMEYSTRIYQVYLKYIAPEDIVVYSIDEVFMDVTDYLNTYKLSAHDLAMKIILDVLETTGITATAGIGTNLFLCLRQRHGRFQNDQQPALSLHHRRHDAVCNRQQCKHLKGSDDDRRTFPDRLLLPRQ